MAFLIFCIVKIAGTVNGNIAETTVKIKKSAWLNVLLRLSRKHRREAVRFFQVQFMFPCIFVMPKMFEFVSKLQAVNLRIVFTNRITKNKTARLIFLEKLSGKHRRAAVRIFQLDFLFLCSFQIDKFLVFSWPKLQVQAGAV